MPEYTSISYHDLHAPRTVLEHQATQTWEGDITRMKFERVGDLKFDVSEVKTPVGEFLNRVVTTGEYVRKNED